MLKKITKTFLFLILGIILLIAGLYVEIQIEKTRKIIFEKQVMEYKIHQESLEKQSMIDYLNFLPFLIMALGFVFVQMSYLEERWAKRKLEIEAADWGRIEKALKESEERFKQVVENTPEWIWETNTQGLYTYANPTVEKILGFKPDEIVGKKYFYDFFHPEDREALKKSALEAFTQKQPFYEFLNRNVHKNGKTVWLSTSGIPMLDERGNLLGYRGADIDISKQKQVEKELEEKTKELQKELEKIERLNKLMIGRELEMIKLKKEIKTIKQ